METVMYDDQPLMDKKKQMTLDFIGAPKKNSVLTTPDVAMLKLASPELEKFIAQQYGTVTTTPTPTQFIYPKNVTAEQADFARGFVDALAMIHHANDGEQTENSSSSSSAAAAVVVVPSSSHHQAAATALPTSSTVVTNSRVADTTTTYTGMATMVNIGRIKQEETEPPQTVPVFLGNGTIPSAAASSLSVDMTPIDLDSQEKIKAERKRARNRVAASKCRKRKLERISRLEDRVKDLKMQNTDLQSTAASLREQVCELKQQVLDHVKRGCQVMLAQQLIATNY